MICRNFVIFVCARRSGIILDAFGKLYFPLKIIFLLGQMSGRKFVDFVRAELGEFLLKFL